MLAFLSLPVRPPLPHRSSELHGLGIPGLAEEAVQAAAADTPPPHWNTASRLALESQFVRASLPPIGARVP
jgi:hypothetical protein